MSTSLVGSAAAAVRDSIGPECPPTLDQQLQITEARAIRRALQLTNGNRRRAAAVLGISLRTLFYKLERLP